MGTYPKVNKSVKDALVKANTFKFDSSLTKKDMVENLEFIGTSVRRFKDKLSTDDLRKYINSGMKVTNTEYTELELSQQEKHTLNFYITTHPVNSYIKMLNLLGNRFNYILPSEINEQLDSTRIAVVGLVESKTSKMTKNNTPYLNLKVSDSIDMVNMNIWSPLSTKVSDIISENEIVVFFGTIKTDTFNVGNMQLNVNGVMPLSRIGGTPLASAGARSPDDLQSIISILGAKVGAMSSVTNRHIAIFSETAYLKLEHVEELSKYQGVTYEVAYKT
jgi:DNA polymerase III alpha subunit